MSMNYKSYDLIVRDVAPVFSSSPVRISASRGRDYLNPLNRTALIAGKNRQFLELGSAIVTNTITSVSKDNLLWLEKEL